MRQIVTICSIVVFIVFGRPILFDQARLALTGMAPAVSRTTPILSGEMIKFAASSTDRINKVVQSPDSGLEGTTYFKVISGVPGGRSTAQPASIEFAVAPVQNDAPSYSKSIFVKSDEAGTFKISLLPGKYWLGPKGKALDPVHYAPASFSVSEETVEVKQGAFTKLDLFQVGYGP